MAAFWGRSVEESHAAMPWAALRTVYRFRRLLPGILFGCGLSLTIELLQILTYRATDVNDLITNVFGTAIGLLLVRPITGRYLPTGKTCAEVYALCGLSFGVMFFLHPFLSPMIWDKIL